MSKGDHGTALKHLAERMGIEGEFRNARGATIQTADATTRNLLSAMGLQVSDERDAQAALGALDREAWQRPLPPVIVARVSAVASSNAVAIEIVLAADVGEVVWRLRLEDGGERSGQAAFDALSLVAEQSVDGRVLQRRRLELGDGLPFGYHRLTVDPGAAATTLVVAPERCWLPPGVADGRRIWGIAIQLYLLRSASNWGLGDFTDLRALVELASTHGADVIGLNPLHAMFSDDPEHASPYAPESRLLLNILNIDVTAVPELRESPEAQALISSPAFEAQLEACRGQHLVNYAGVTKLEIGGPRIAFRDVQQRARQTALAGIRGVPASTRRGARA